MVKLFVSFCRVNFVVFLKSGRLASRLNGDSKNKQNGAIRESGFVEDSFKLVLLIVDLE